MSAKVFNEWMEFTPYEIGLPKYGTYVKPKDFLCKFFMGNIVKRFPEPPLHFLQGIWGSCFCIQAKSWATMDSCCLKEEDIRTAESEMIKTQGDDSGGESSSDSESSGGEDEVDDKSTVRQEGGISRKRSKSTKMKQKSWWSYLSTSILECEWFQNIEIRAAKVFNFMRGLPQTRVYAISPFTQLAVDDEMTDDGSSTFEKIHCKVPNSRKMYVVDSGLSFNSPYPLLLRPQRYVDLILSFDFTQRPSDDAPMFKELLLAEKWAKLNKVQFPPIDETVVEKEGLKECYVFKHPHDVNCPIVLHFCLINHKFKQEISPGVPRETKEDKEFGDFAVFDNPMTPYTSFNFQYSPYDFQRLFKLAEYNTLVSKDIIFSNISTCIKRKRMFSFRAPCKVEDILKLSLKSKTKQKNLLKHIKMVDTLNMETQDEGEVEAAKSRPTSVCVPVLTREKSGDEEVKDTGMKRHGLYKPSDMGTLEEESDDRESGEHGPIPRSRTQQVDPNMKTNSPGFKRRMGARHK